VTCLQSATPAGAGNQSGNEGAGKFVDNTESMTALEVRDCADQKGKFFEKLESKVKLMIDSSM
jgi:hypothetical protein